MKVRNEAKNSPSSQTLHPQILAQSFTKIKFPFSSVDLAGLDGDGVVGPGPVAGEDVHAGGVE